MTAATQRPTQRLTRLCRGNADHRQQRAQTDDRLLGARRKSPLVPKRWPPPRGMTRTGSHRSLIAPFVAVFCRRLTFDYNRRAHDSANVSASRSAQADAHMDCGSLSLSLLRSREKDRKGDTRGHKPTSIYISIYPSIYIVPPTDYLLNATSLKVTQLRPRRIWRSRQSSLESLRARTTWRRYVGANDDKRPRPAL